MKIKQTVLLLGLATFGLVSFAQDNAPVPAPGNPPPPPPEPTQTAPATPTPPAPDQGQAAPAAPTPAVTNAPAPTTTNAPAPVTPEQAQVTPATPPPVGVTPVFAQTPAAAGTPAATPAAAAPADPVPLIVIDDVPLTDAIRNLARQSSLNFQFDPRITQLGPDNKPTNQPNVSIRFENVTAQEALQAVLDNYNLVLVQDPKSKIARVTVKDPKAEDPLVSRTIQLKYSDPTNMINLVKSTLSVRSTVMADIRTSQLIITTTEKETEGVINLISRLDTPTKQVLIEARIFETAHNPSSVHGIDWSGTLQNQNFQFGNNAIGGIPGSPATFNPVTGGTTPATPAIPGGILSTPRLLVDTAKGFNPATAFLNADGVSGVLSFLNNDADTEVVATPRAVTLDNQTAKLEVTRAFPIFLITPGSANSPAGSSITYTNLGTILSVTPRIAADKNISLRVVPEVSNIDSKDTETINGQVNTANIYAIRRIDTRVMIPSGNTLVMGGLINDTKAKNYVKVPILGDLPGIGLAFRHDSKVRNKQNLLIFITPTIVEDEAFHVTSSAQEFLNNRIIETPDVEESAWESGKPHDWSKPVY